MANTYIIIASNVLSSPASSVSFTSIPNTYDDLVARVVLRGTQAGYYQWMLVRLNSDTGGNYSKTQLWATGTSAASNRDSSYFGDILSYAYPDNLIDSNTFSNNEIYFANYTSTTTKVLSIIGGFSATTTNNNVLAATVGRYATSSAISTITFSPGALNFATGSEFYLYGIKNT